MNRKILITGINGFVGTNCHWYFLNMGSEVFGIDICGNKLSDKICIGEVNKENLSNFNQKFDLIIHLAGSGTVGIATKNPEAERKKSVNSLIEVLEYMKTSNQQAKLIFASSASVYGDKYKNKIKETAELNPISEYGRQKVEAESICREYGDKFDLDIKIIRFFSLYGVGNKKQLLYDVLNRIKELDGSVLPCYGSGNEERDFINIKDAIRFVDLVSKTGKKFDIFNCASGTNINVKEITEQLAKMYSNKCLTLEFDKIEREGNPKVLLADISKAIRIGFKPTITFEEGIREYVEWFKTL